MSYRSDDDNGLDKMSLVGRKLDKIVLTATKGGTFTTTTVVTNQYQQNGRIIFTTKSTGTIKFHDDSN